MNRVDKTKPIFPGKLSNYVNLPGIAVIVIFVLFWQVYARTLGAHFDSIASSAQIFVAIKNLVVNGPLLGQLFHTAAIALAGWIVASCIGLFMGLAIGLCKPAWTYSMASIDVLRSIPSISFVSIAVLLFGFSPSTEMVIVIYVSMWPLLMGTIGGINAVPVAFIDVAQTLRLSRWATTFKIVIPSALPTIIVGLRLSLTLSIALAVVAEMVGNPDGLGFGMVMSQQAIKPADALGYLVVIGLVGWCLNTMFVTVARRLCGAHGSIL